MIEFENQHYFFQYQILEAIKTKNHQLIDKIRKEYPDDENLNRCLSSVQVQAHFQKKAGKTPNILTKRQVYEILFRSNKTISKTFKDAIYQYFEDELQNTKEQNDENLQLINTKQQIILDRITHQFQHDQQPIICLCYSQLKQQYALITRQRRTLNKTLNNKHLQIIRQYDSNNGFAFKQQFKRQLNIKGTYFDFDNQNELEQRLQ